jgi:hypothetical protein
LKENLEENNANLIVVDSDKQAKNYKKIFDFLEVEVKILDNIADLVNIFFNKIGNYIVEKNFFEKHNLENFYQLENYFSLKFEKNISVNLEENLKKLNDFSYKNSEYIEDFTFNKT